MKIENLKTKDQVSINYALMKAYQHVSNGKQKIYAIATDSKGTILAEAGNHYHAEHPVQSQQRNLWAGYQPKKYQQKGGYKGFNIHAEILLLERLKRVPKEKRSKVYIYIARSGSNLNPLNSKPCMICENAINKLTKRLNIQKVFYT